MGAAKRIGTARDRLRTQERSIKRLEALNRLINVPRPIAATRSSGSSAAGDTGGGTGNFLKTEGDTMIGPFALNPPVDFRVIVDSNDTIDIGASSTNNQYSSNIQLDDLQTNSSVLTIITGGGFNGQLLVIRTFAPTIPYTISQNTVGNSGNIELPDSTDLTVGDLETLIFIFDAELITNVNTGGTWRLLSRSDPGTGGGGDITEPIELGFNEVTTETPPTFTVIAGDVFNPSHIDLDQDITLQLDISATASKYKSLFVIFDTTGGSFTVTWPASVTNPPIIDDSIAQRISVILYTIDNGVLWTHATSVGSSTTGGEFFGPWTANHDAGDFSLVNLAAVAIVDTGGLARGSISGDAGATAVRLSLATANKFIISDVLTDIAEFDNATGLTIKGTHVINMSKNIINTIGSLQFDNSATFTPTNENSIGFDQNNNFMKYSVALTSDAHVFFANGELLASITRVGSNSGSLNVDNVVANLLQANELIDLSTFTNSTPSNGNIWLDLSSGLFQFRQNGSTVGLSGSPLTTKGDLYGFSTVDARIPVGANGQVLTANSAVSLGVEWASGGGGEFFGPWTANHDAGDFALNNVSSIQISDSVGGVHALLQGLATPETRLTLTTGEKFSIFDNITSILEIDNATGLKMIGTHVINMSKNIINTIGSLQFDGTVTFTPTNVTTIGFDSSNSFLIYNVALTSYSHVFKANGELLASITRIAPNSGQLSVDAVVAETLLANDKLEMQNGFSINNTNSTTTEFTIPSSEVLKIIEGSDIRIQVDKNIILDADLNDDILFKENGTTTLGYDGGLNAWTLFSPNTLQINSGAEIDFISSSSSASAGAQTLPSNPIGFVIIRVAGTLRRIPFYGA